MASVYMVDEQYISPEGRITEILHKRVFASRKKAVEYAKEYAEDQTSIYNRNSKLRGEDAKYYVINRGIYGINILAHTSLISMERTTFIIIKIEVEE